MLFAPEIDNVDFALWQPLEFMKQNDLQYSMRWVYMESQPLIFDHLQIFAEKNMTGYEFAELLNLQTQFPLNLVFTTSTGDIGYKMTGKFPLRKYNVGYGTYPKKGWMKENQWDGYIPNSELPAVVNPERGYVISANNLATTKHIKHGISHAFAFPHRFLRI